MLKLQNCLLRKELKFMQKSHSFNLIKSLSSFRAQSANNRNISFRMNSGEFATNRQTSKTIQDKQDSSHMIELENKQLYLRYVEQVLTNKERELIEKQDKINQIQQDIDRNLLKNSLLTPLKITIELEQTITKLDQVKSFLSRYTSKQSLHPILSEKDRDQYLKRQTIIEEECQALHFKTEEIIQKEYDKLIEERKEYNEKISKLNELQSYQKYLNELQILLEKKEDQIMKKCKDAELNNAFYINSQSSNTNQYNTFQRKAEQPTRKRAKIFDDPKLFQSSINDSFGGQQQKFHKESSKIMQENSTTHEGIHRKSKGDEIVIEEEAPQIVTKNIQVQTSFQTLDRAIERLTYEQKCIKFCKIYLKYASNAGKTSNNYKKALFMQRWRINSIFDEKLLLQFKKVIEWPSKIEKLGEQSLFPYNQLSLKKKKYAELFFDYERKQFQQKKILNSLKSVLRNKNRKERLAVVLYFRKYRQNSKILSFSSNRSKKFVLSQKNISNNQDSKPKLSTSHGAQSRIYSMSSSNVMNQNRALAPGNSKQKVKFQQASSKKLSQNPSNGNLLKSRSRSIKDISNSPSFDMKKLKQYIREQEETEAKLAINCVKIQSILKFQSTLVPIVNRHINAFFLNFMKTDETQRLLTVEKKINSYEFKWQLFIAKLRLALANNTNKIAHLQQMLGFIMIDK